MVLNAFEKPPDTCFLQTVSRPAHNRGLGLKSIYTGPRLAKNAALRNRAKSQVCAGYSIKTAPRAAARGDLVCFACCCGDLACCCAGLACCCVGLACCAGFGCCGGLTSCCCFSGCFSCSRCACAWAENMAPGRTNRIAVLRMVLMRVVSISTRLEMRAPRCPSGSLPESWCQSFRNTGTRASADRNAHAETDPIRQTSLTSFGHATAGSQRWDRIARMIFFFMAGLLCGAHLQACRVDIRVDVSAPTSYAN
jgi:hypothetical protein